MPILEFMEVVVKEIKIQDNWRKFYCSSTNTIFLVKEDVDLFYELNDSSGLLYLLAHEWSHSLQHAWLMQNTSSRKRTSSRLFGWKIRIYV